MRESALSVFLIALLGHCPVQAEDGWRTLFNGHDLAGWRTNLHPDSARVVDGAIRLQSVQDRVHLFYAGNGGPGSFERFKNFELRLQARGEPGANSGVFFHTDFSARDRQQHLAKGYEVQLNSSTSEKRKTGSLYAVVDLDASPVDETRWFDVAITVRGQRITVALNGRTVVDYVEPANPNRPAERSGRVLDPDGGAIALQAHDPASVFYFKDIRIRRLPD